MIYILLIMIIMIIVLTMIVYLLVQVINRLQKLIEVILTAQSEYTDLQIRAMESIVNQDTSFIKK